MPASIQINHLMFLQRSLVGCKMESEFARWFQIPIFFKWVNGLFLVYFRSFQSSCYLTKVGFKLVSLDKEGKYADHDPFLKITKKLRQKILLKPNT